MLFFDWKILAFIEKCWISLIKYTGKTCPRRSSWRRSSSARRSVSYREMKILRNENSEKWRFWEMKILRNEDSDDRKWIFFHESSMENEDSSIEKWRFYRQACWWRASLGVQGTTASFIYTWRFLNRKWSHSSLESEDSSLENWSFWGDQALRRSLSWRTLARRITSGFGSSRGFTNTSKARSVFYTKQSQSALYKTNEDRTCRCFFTRKSWFFCFKKRIFSKLDLPVGSTSKEVSIKFSIKIKFCIKIRILVQYKRCCFCKDDESVTEYSSLWLPNAPRCVV